nr:hypothetical protein [Tanacetum cinerariifolium]
ATAEMYVLAVCASDVWGVVLSCSTRRRDKFQWKSTVEQLSAELAQYKAKELQRQGSSVNDSDGTNAPCTSPQSLVVATESQPLLERMDELTSQLSDNETDGLGPQDIYFKVMGNNSNATAEMYALAVCASDVWGVVLSCSTRRRDKFQWKSTVEQLSAELAQYKVKELQSQGSSVNDSDGTNAPCTSPQSLVVATESQPLLVFIVKPNENGFAVILEITSAESVTVRETTIDTLAESVMVQETTMDTHVSTTELVQKKPANYL